MGEDGHSRVLIVGAGFGGLAMALELTRAGIEDFLILERGGDVGGVWRENTYPGAACDIPSPYYSFSFEPNPNWSSRFSGQAEILDYLRGVVEKYGLRDRIRFGVDVESAEFDEANARWRVHSDSGEVHTADVFVPATGQLSRPSLPAIPGIGSFRGPAFHSATWDHTVDLTGKRVAVVGTGASAVQFVPRIQPDAAHITLFQRSAPWIMPRPEIRYRPWQHTLFRRAPITQLAERFTFWLMCEVLALGLVDVPAVRPVVSAIARRHLRKQVPDPRLRAILEPDYAAGCKRALFSNDYLPAVSESNVDVVTSDITEILPNGVRTADGAVHEVDVIVYGTGFKATEFLGPISVQGTGGVQLADVWSEGAHAYLGMAVPGFPNMFVMYGPNTNLGVGSIVHVLESQSRYIRQAVRRIADHGLSTVDVRVEVADGYDVDLQERLGRSVWTMCSSWYRDESGRISSNWPGGVSSYRLSTRALDPDDFHVYPARTWPAATARTTAAPPDPRP